MHTFRDRRSAGLPRALFSVGVHAAAREEPERRQAARVGRHVDRAGRRRAHRRRRRRLPGHGRRQLKNGTSQTVGLGIVVGAGRERASPATRGRPTPTSRPRCSRRSCSRSRGCRTRSQPADALPPWAPTPGPRSRERGVVDRGQRTQRRFVARHDDGRHRGVERVLAADRGVAQRRREVGEVTRRGTRRAPSRPTSPPGR